MRLKTYLKQFKHIAWYPAADRDIHPIVCLSALSLAGYGINRDEAPDCFIYTDYNTYSRFRDNHRFVLDTESLEEVLFSPENVNPSGHAFNIKELERLRIDFDRDMVDGEADEYYGRVFTFDILVEHEARERYIAKMIYVVVENTRFAFDFLIREHINIDYVIHSNYGFGFGGGRSNGAFLFNILNDLHTKYLVADMVGEEHYEEDLADRYLSEDQKHTLPVLREIINFTNQYGWCGYGDTKLFKVVEFRRIGVFRGGWFNDDNPTHPKYYLE